MKTDETRARILSVARTLFTERGLFDTQMTDVAEALGLSRTTLYRYYRDKLDLAMAIVEILVKEIHAHWDDSGPWLGTCRERVGLYLRQVWADPGENATNLHYLAEFDAFFSGSRIPKGFKQKIQAAIPFDGDPKLLQLIVAGQDEGSIHRELDPHLVMATLINAVRGLHQRLLLRGEVLVELRPHEAERLIDELISYLLKGIAPGGTP